MDLKQTVKEKTNSELLEMVYQLDQWSVDMLIEVEAELSLRNVLPSDISIIKQSLIEQEEIHLSKGKDASTTGLILGWLLVFGLLGIIIGYNYAFEKKRSKYTGQDYFKYSDASRKKGKNLFYTSLLLSIITILYKLASI